MIAERGKTVPTCRLDRDRLDCSSGEKCDDRHDDDAEPEPDRPPILFLPEFAPAWGRCGFRLCLCPARPACFRLAHVIDPNSMPTDELHVSSTWCRDWRSNKRFSETRKKRGILVGLKPAHFSMSVLPMSKPRAKMTAAPGEFPHDQMDA